MDNRQVAYSQNKLHPNQHANAEDVYQVANFGMNNQQSGYNTYSVRQILTDLSHGENVQNKGYNQQAYKSKLQPSFQFPLDSKYNCLQNLIETIVSKKTMTIAAFEDCQSELFRGLEACLATNQLQSLYNPTQNHQPGDKSKGVDQANESAIEVVLKANLLLFEIMPEIQKSKLLEAQMANLIPSFIENLGSPKAVVRKSTHKCIGTYVKLTKKLEYVLTQIVTTGLENVNSRTRQHSMLVIPALLSLKAQVMDFESQELKQLVAAVIRRIQYDSSEIVGKTGKKLILELQKCYTTAFRLNYIDSIENISQRKIAGAIVEGNDAELKSLLAQGQAQQPSVTSTSISAATISPSKRSDEAPRLGNQRGTRNVSSQLQSGNDTSQLEPVHPSSASNRRPTEFIRTGDRAGGLKSIGRDIVLSSPTNAIAASAAGQATTTNAANQSPMRERALPEEPKSTTSVMNATPECFFNCIQQPTLMELQDGRSWRERTNAIETVERLLNESVQQRDAKLSKSAKASLLDQGSGSTEVIAKLKQQDVEYYSGGGFIEFLIPLMDDVNFKVSLTSINMLTKLLVLNVVELDEKLYRRVACMLIDKLSDSKVVIRQAILKACGLMIKNCGAFRLAQVATRYVQHTNWHVREGILNILANCLIIQNQIDELSGGRGLQDLTSHTPLIQELALLCAKETKDKIRVMVIDCFALMLDVARDASTTEKLINDAIFKSAANQGEAISVSKKVQHRHQKGFMPQMQIDGSIEFQPDHGLVNTSFSQEVKRGEVQDAIYQRKQTEDASPSAVLKVVKQPSKERALFSGDQEQDADQDASKSIHKSEGPQYIRRQQKNFSAQVSHADNHKMQAAMADQEAPLPSTSEYTPDLRYKAQSREPAKYSFDNTANHSQSDQKSIGSNEPQIGLRPRGIQKFDADRRNQSIQDQNPTNDERYERLMNGYTPIQHFQRPRVIQSNEIRQRTLESASVSQTSPSPNLMGSQNHTKNDFLSIQQSPLIGTGASQRHRGVHDGQSLHKGDSTKEFGLHDESTPEAFKITQVRNMSQSSGAPGGFGVNKAQINERLQLLKSTFKYKNQSEHETRSQIGDTNAAQRGGFDHSERKLTYEIPAAKKASSEYNARQATKLPSVVNNNNYMMQSSGTGSAQITGLMIGLGGGVGQQSSIEKPQQTLNSFGISNVSTNINQNISSKNYAGGKSFSANKQLQSTKTGTTATGYTQDRSRRNQHQEQDDPYMRQQRSFGNADSNLDYSNQSNLAERNSVQRRPGIRGPVRANHPPAPSSPNSIMNTIQDQSSGQPDSAMQHLKLQQNSMSDNYANIDKQSISSVNKPPMAGKMRHPDQYQRATSVNQPSSAQKSFYDAQNDNSFFTPKKSWQVRKGGPDTEDAKRSGGIYGNQTATHAALGATATSQTTHYNATEEPLSQPENQLQQAITNLTSKDWNKVFDALNTVKRAAQFHKELLTMQSGGSSKECLKAVVKQTENLRSQVAKNACLTLLVAYQELPTKDLDASIDVVLHALVKKATDTNKFVSEQAEKALTMVCHACSETKVLQSLQSIDGRGNALKLKIALCYATLLEKLGPKVKTFKDSARLIRAVVSLLDEGAIEVRNQAKIAVLQMQSSLSNQREFDALMVKSALSEKQKTQVMKVIEQGDLGQLSAANNTTRYGSIRGSSLDSRGFNVAQNPNSSGYQYTHDQSSGLGQRRTPHVIPKYVGLGSDGFQNPPHGQL